MIIMVKGTAGVPERFWDYIEINESEEKEYREKGYVLSNKNKSK